MMISRDGHALKDTLRMKEVRCSVSISDVSCRMSSISAYLAVTFNQHFNSTSAGEEVERTECAAPSSSSTKPGGGGGGAVHDD